MSGVVFPLIAEGQHTATNVIAGLRPDVTGYSETPEENYFPRCETLWHKMFRQVTYSVSVIGTTGTAPTSWSLGARFEQFVPHTTQYSYALPVWAPLSREQLAKCIEEGIGWGGETNPAAFGIIASSASVPDFATTGALPNGLTVNVGGDSAAALITTRVTRTRTVKNQMGGVRVRLNPVITGGDATTQILLSVNATGVR